MKNLFLAAVIIAALAAFFASANPDGLDFVSEKLGFSEKGVERTAPMTDYSVQFLPEGGVSTATAGVAGILITLAVFWLAAFILKKGDNGIKKTMVFALASLLVQSVPSFAARPLVTDDFGTVDTGKYEIELGYNSITPKVGGGTTSGLVYQIKRGFTPSFDLGVELPYTFGTPSGPGDAVLHAKLKVNEFGEDEGITARADVKLTNGDPVTGLGSGFTDYGIILILSKKVSGLNAHFNAGYVVIGDPANSTTDDTVVFGAALEADLPFPGIEAAAEFTNISCQLGCTGNLQVGGRWQASDIFRLDAGYSVGINDNSNNIATAGFTAEF